MSNRLNIIYILNGNWKTDHRMPQMKAVAEYCNLICIEKPVTPATPCVFFKYLKSGWKPRCLGENLKIFKPVALTPYSIIEKNLILQKLNKYFFNYFIRKWVLPRIERPDILMLSHPFQRSFIGLFKEKLLCYEITDAYDKITFFRERKNKKIGDIEKQVLSRADIVFTSARGLQKNKERHNSNIYFIPNGTDVKLFSKSLDPNIRIPEDLDRIQPPRVGLIGHITVNVDLEIIQTMAQKHPEWSIVIIGDIKVNKQIAQRDLLKRLQVYPNVYFLGVKPYEFLPFYQKGIDVCLLPYKRNDYNRYVHPNKLYQYLAGGKPVVSTDLPELRPFADLISIGNDADEFVGMVEDALKQRDSYGQIRERVRVAMENSVQKSAEQRARLLRDAFNMERKTGENVKG